MTDLAADLAHAEKMSGADHTPACLVKDHYWSKLRPTCGTPRCVTDNDRALWNQLAREYRAHLDRHRQETLL